MTMTWNYDLIEHIDPATVASVAIGDRVLWKK
jgi:hypothetical protein